MIGFHFRFKMVRINKSIRNQQTRSAYVIAIFRWPFLVLFCFQQCGCRSDEIAANPILLWELIIMGSSREVAFVFRCQIKH